MANSYVSYPVSGTSYAITFDYLDTAHIYVYVDTSLQSSGFSITGGNVVFDSTPVGSTVKIQRLTPRTLAGLLVDFEDGAVLTESDLDTSQRQLLFIAQEAFEVDQNNEVLPDASYLPYDTGEGLWDAAVSSVVKAIKGVADSTDPTSAATRGYVDELALFGVAGNPKVFTGTIATSQPDYELVGFGSQVSIEPAMLIVAIGGVLQTPGDDFTILSTDVNGNAQIRLLPTPDSSLNGEDLTVINFGKAKTASSVADGGITTVKLANDAVTADKLADSPTSSTSRAVTENHIRDGAVSTTRLADNAVTAAKLADGAVDEASILTEAVSYAKLKKNDFAPAPGGSAPQVLKISTTGVLSRATLDGSEITNLSDAVSDLPISDFAAATDNVNMGVNGGTKYQIKNLATPSADDDAATQGYVKSSIADLGPILLADETLDVDQVTWTIEGWYDDTKYVSYKVVCMDFAPGGTAASNFSMLCGSFKDSGGTYVDSTNGYYSWGSTSSYGAASPGVDGSTVSRLAIFTPRASGRHNFSVDLINNRGGKTGSVYSLSTGTGRCREAISGGFGAIGHTIDNSTQDSIYTVASRLNSGSTVQGLRFRYRATFTDTTDDGVILAGARVMVYGYKSLV